MPIIKVEMLEGRSKEQKRKLAKALTQAMVEIAKTDSGSVTVVFSEYSRESWAQAGKLLSD